MAGGALGFLIPPNVLMIINAFLVREFVGKPFAVGLRRAGKPLATYKLSRPFACKSADAFLEVVGLRCFQECLALSFKMLGQ